MQNSNTSRMIFDLPAISRLTHADTGDVMLTGTPGGVAYRDDPKVLRASGDRPSVTIGDVGELNNATVAVRRGERMVPGKDR